MTTLTRLAIGTALAVGSLAALGGTAFAQQPAQSSPPNGSNGCPPGSWFCADTQEKPAAPAGQPVQPLQPLPDPNAPPPANTQPPVVTYAPAPPVVVYQ